MQCANCGQPLSPGDRFCPSCGTPVPNATLPAADVAPFAPLPLPSESVPPAPLQPQTWQPVEPLPQQWPSPNSASFSTGNLTPPLAPTYPRAVNASAPLIVGTIALVIIVLAALLGVGAAVAGPFSGLFHPNPQTSTVVTLPNHTSTIGAANPTAPPLATAVPTTPPAPTATTAPALSCAQAMGGHPATNVGGAFSDVPLPGGAYSTGITIASSGTGRYAVENIRVCAPNLDAQGVDTFFAQAMSSQGWSAPFLYKVPYDGGYFVPCHGKQAGLCWTKGAVPRYVSLENENVEQGLTIFTLDLFQPPPAPNCNFSGQLQSFYIIDDSQALYVALPPLTYVGMSQGATQNIIVPLCSSGTVASIQSFLNYTMPIQNWTSVGNNTWTAKGY